MAANRKCLNLSHNFRIVVGNIAATFGKGKFQVSKGSSFRESLLIMALGLGQLFYAVLLFINAIAVLSEERFLARSESFKFKHQ